MNCRSLTEKRPAKGKTPKIDSTKKIWANEWNEKGQLLSIEEPISRLLETQ
jgi:hypothetical protein